MSAITEKYVSFLKQKIKLPKNVGIEIQESDVSDFLKPHQKDAVVWAVSGGRRALFESFGLGKTLQQLEICKIFLEKEGGKSLIVCPLGVRHEFTQSAIKFYNRKLQYVTTQEECDLQPEGSWLITNYERVRDGNINPNTFTVISLDEASVLRSYGSDTYQTFLSKFDNVKYKFVCTATPSPNKFKELIHYGGFLSIMDTGQALTRFFKRDSTKANKLTLHPHKETEFWLWLSSWALFLQKPSDLGYSDEGYALPKLNIHYHCIDAKHEASFDEDGQGRIFDIKAIGLKSASKEKKVTLKDRVLKAKEILESDIDRHCIIWHDLEDERKEIMKQMPYVLDVFGAQNMDVREQRIIDFSEGRIKHLATKPVISGQGCNFQYHCNKAIFTGIGYKFNDFIQAIYRIYRFLQKEQCDIHIIYTENESQILQELKRKWEQHDYLVSKMSEIIKEHGLNSTSKHTQLMRILGVDRKFEEGKNYKFYHNDNVLEVQNLADNSVHLIHTSIPFANHYEYTPTYNDFGHTDSNEHFWQQMDFLTPELLRVLSPGRICAVHIKDRVLFGNATGDGMPQLDGMLEETLIHFKKHGFRKLGVITIETDVVRENNQTYRLGWSEKCKDGSKMGVGCPEYLLLFRKLPSDTSKAYADIKVEKSKKEYTRGNWQIDARAKWNSSGDRFLSPKEIETLGIDRINKFYSEYMKERDYNYENHVDVTKELDALGKLPAEFQTLNIPARGFWVWDDVNRMLTLNSSQTKRKLNMHICPLQFDIVDRTIELFTNEGETVLDPFGGLGTIPYRAIKKKRKGIAIELNHESYKDGLFYCRKAESEIEAPTLFDTL